MCTLCMFACICIVQCTCLYKQTYTVCIHAGLLVVTWNVISVHVCSVMQELLLGAACNKVYLGTKLKLHAQLKFQYTSMPMVRRL